MMCGYGGLPVNPLISGAIFLLSCGHSCLKVASTSVWHGDAYSSHILPPFSDHQGMSPTPAMTSPSFSTLLGLIRIRQLSLI